MRCIPPGQRRGIGFSDRIFCATIVRGNRTNSQNARHSSNMYNLVGPISDASCLLPNPNVRRRRAAAAPRRSGRESSHVPRGKAGGE